MWIINEGDAYLVEECVQRLTGLVERHDCPRDVHRDAQGLHELNVCSMVSVGKCASLSTEYCVSPNEEGRRWEGKVSYWKVPCVWRSKEEMMREGVRRAQAVQTVFGLPRMIEGETR